MKIQVIIIQIIQVKEIQMKIQMIKNYVEI